MDVSKNHWRRATTHVVLLEERLRVLVRVDEDLGEGVVKRGVLLPGGDSGLDPGEDELEPVPLLDLFNKLLDGERSRDGSEEVLDGSLVAVDIEQSSDDLRSSGRVDALDVGLDGGRETVLVEEKDEVVDEVEPVADDDEGELVRKLGLFKSGKKRRRR